MDTLSLTTTLAVIVVSGIACQWLSHLIRVPSILLLLLMGLFLGPIAKIIDPEKVFCDLLSPITSLSVAIILFEGGMSLKLSDAKKIGHIVNNLVTFGALACIVSTFLFLYYAVGYSLEFSLLQSAILVITGPTVITPMLNQMHIDRKLRSILNWEGIVIDPIGAITAVVIFEAIVGKPGHPTIEVILYAIISSLTFGIIIGAIGAGIILYSLRRLWIPDKIQSPVTLMMVFLVYTSCDFIHPDSGLIGVTVMGFILGNQNKFELQHIIDFKESLTVILISFLFITLAGTVQTELLFEAIDETVALFLFLVLVARPLTVLFSGAFWTVSFKEALFMCCIAPRGIVTAAVASLFGLELTIAGFPEASYHAPITFGIIIGTVIFYSVFSPVAARYLGVSSKSYKQVLIVGANPLALEIGKALIRNDYNVQFIDPNFWKATKAKLSTLQVFRGTFLEYEKKFQDDLEWTDLVLALTENDDINSMAIINMRKYFDESQLYQLGASTKKIHESQMGQRLFGEGVSFTSLKELLNRGFSVKTTKLSKQFPFSKWEESHGKEGILLFQIDKNGVLKAHTAENPLTPDDTGKIISIS